MGVDAGLVEAQVQSAVQAARDEVAEELARVTSELEETRRDLALASETVTRRDAQLVEAMDWAEQATSYQEQFAAATQRAEAAEAQRDTATQRSEAAEAQRDALKEAVKDIQV